MIGARSMAVWGLAASVMTLMTQGAAADSRTIASITVCSVGVGDSGPSCPQGSFDTQQIVLGPDGASINLNGVGAASDEHSSVFPPGALQGNPDYRFLVASGTAVNPDVGVVALSGGAGPDAKGQWTLSYAPGYGAYAEGNGTVFLAPVVQGRCPTVADGNAAHQDQTFDLTYAAAGSVVIDPTAGPGSLLMFYEGSNSCTGSTGGVKPGGGAYITAGVATSLDYGRTWPSYRGTSTFNFVPLPHANRTQGPKAPLGALGASVCAGTDCTIAAPAGYGRYAALAPPASLPALMSTGAEMNDNTGDSEPAAFVDDASAGPSRYVYEIYTYVPGSASGAADQLPDGRKKDLAVARAQLNGGTAPLQFLKWNGAAFAETGVGGREHALLPDGAFENCADTSQGRSQGSIGYVDETQQYLLLFVCNSPGDPATGQRSAQQGSAWFYATSNTLTDENAWSPPREIAGTWMSWDTGTPAGSYGCPSYRGWYPTIMSLARPAGHLATNGFVFYLWGCLGGGANPPKRQYASRAFSIAVATATVVEYFNPDLGDYFITADPVEQNFVDSGAVGRWQRTGGTFAAGGANQVCRFYGNTNVNPATGAIFGPNSHFYTADAAECASLKALYSPSAKSWKFESNDFLTTPAVGGACPPGLVPVYRAYNNGFARGIDSNHRITVDHAAYQQTVSGGWIGEGIVMCAP